MKRMLMFVLALALSTAAWASQPVDHIGTPAPVKAVKPQTPAGPKAVTWTTLADITPAASRLTAAAVNGKIYRLGGNVAAGTTFSNVVEEFDPATGSWTTKTPLPLETSNLSSTVWRNQIYIPGGYSGSYLTNLQIYYPDGDSVAQGTAMPAGCYGSATAVLADTLYVFGGNNGAAINTVYAYNLVAKTWTAKTSMPTARYFGGAVTIGSKIYVVGGFTGSTDLNTVEMYDPTADTAGGAPWTTKAPMTTARGGLGLAEIGGQIYAFGGVYYTWVNTVEKYNPAADTVLGTPWTPDTSFVTARRTIGAARLGNDAYVIGGWAGAFSAAAERGRTDAPVVDDVEMQRIRVMPYVGNYGVVVHPSLGVANNTPFWQYNTPLTLRIDSAGIPVYNHTIFQNLGPISGYSIILPDWRPCTTPGIVYDLTAYNSLTSDQDQANDTVRTTVTVKDAVWFQYDSTASVGHPAQNFESGYDMYDCWIADDFSIDGVDTVRIDSIAIRGAYSGGGGPADSLSLTITSDSSWYPAFSQTVAAAMVLPANFSDNAGTFMARLNPPFKLPAAERYWLVGQTGMNYSPSGQWFWTNYAGVLNYATTTAYFLNPGDGFSAGATNWTPVSAIWSGTSNYSFVLYGGQYITGVAGNPVTTGFQPDLRLAQVTPNPVRGDVRFSFSLAKAGYAKLDVYSLTGQKVATIADSYRASGPHSVSWNGLDKSGRKVSAGLYFYRLTTDSRSLTRKFVVVR